MVDTPLPMYRDEKLSQIYPPDGEGRTIPNDTARLLFTGKLLCRMRFETNNRFIDEACNEPSLSSKSYSDVRR